MYILYTNGSMLAVPQEEDLRQLVAGIKVAGLDITKEGVIEDFLGVNIDKVYIETYHLW